MIRFLFFFRSFNGLDHLIPLLWRLRAEQEVRAEVYCIDSSLEFRGFTVVDNIREWTGREPRYLVDEVGKNMVGLRTWKAVASTSRSSRLVKGKIGYFRRRLSQVSSSRIDVALAGNSTWAEGFIEQKQPAGVLFDWGRSDRATIGPILNACRKRSIPSYALPHGIVAFLGSNQTAVKPFDYDYFFLSGVGCAEHYVAAGANRERFVSIGCMRYSREWMAFLAERNRRKQGGALRFPNVYLPESSKLKVAMFLRKERSAKDALPLCACLSMLGGRDDIEFIAKGHTGKQSVIALRPVLKAGQVRFAPADLATSDIIVWADVCLNYGSSVAIDAYLHDKTNLHLRYLVKKPYDYEACNACWVIDSLDELQAAIGKLVQEPGFRPYEKEAVHELLSRNVYGGDYDRNVIDDYYQFLMERVPE